MESMQQLIEQRNALREQNEKLQGSVRSQETIINHLSEEEVEVINDRDKYKKAFEEIFDKNVGLQWEKFVEDSKTEIDKEDLNEKVAFFNKAINNAKLYVLQRSAELAKKKAESEISEIIEERENMHQVADMALSVLISIDKQAYGRKGKFFQGISSAASALNLPYVELKEKCEALAATPFDTGKANGLETFGADEEKSAGAFADILGTPSLEEKVQQKTETVAQDSVTIIAEAYNAYKDKNPDKFTGDMIEFKKNAKESMKGQLLTVCLEAVLGEGNAAQIQEASEEKQEKIQRYVDVAKKIVHAIGADGAGTVKAILSSIGDVDGGETFLRKVLGDKVLAAGFINRTTSEAIGSGRKENNYELTHNGIILFDALFGENEKIRQPGFRFTEDGEDQKSPGHKKLIDTTRAILEDNGFICEEEVRFELGRNGEAAICDIMANKNGKDYWIECEMNEGTTKHYKDKLQKILQTGKTQKAFFVVKNVEDKKEMEAKLLSTDFPGTSFSVQTVDILKDATALNRFLRADKE